MLYNCVSLKNLELFSFSNINISNMDYMFYNCKSLNYLELSTLNIKYVKTTKYMLYNCRNYKNLDLSFYESNNIDINDIFGFRKDIIYNIDKIKKN